jgi:hypothetical protein
MHIIKSLMAQFLLGAILLIALIGLISYSQIIADQNKNLLSQWSSDSEKLRLELSSLQQQAQHYKLNAPRDFESYNRDIAVFYQQFKQELSKINNINLALENSASKVEANPLLKTINENTDSPLRQSQAMLNTWLQQWSLFSNNMDDKLGDPINPRLEWGADLVLEQFYQLQQHTNTLTNSINTSQEWLNNHHTHFNYALLALILIYIVIALIILGLLVIRPIILTSKACEKVASGQYGLHIKVPAIGETKRLQQSFNELSATTKLVMDMLTEIHQPADVETKLQRIFDSGNEALGINWIGLMICKDDNFELIGSAPRTLKNSWRHKNVSVHKQFGKDLLASFDKRWLDIQQLSKLALQRHDERFLREVHKNTRASHMVGHPFHCPKHNGFLLMFTTQQEHGFSPSQIDLIKALVSLMSDALIAGLSYQPNSN